MLISKINEEVDMPPRGKHMHASPQRDSRGDTPVLGEQAYTVEEALHILNMGRTTLYAEARSRRITLRKRGGRTLLLRSDIESYLASLPSLTFEGTEG